jgi:hypothetical protein
MRLNCVPNLDEGQLTASEYQCSANRRMSGPQLDLNQ